MAADLPIQPMGGHAGQAGDLLDVGAAKDGGQWPRSTSKGKKDERGGVGRRRARWIRPRRVNRRWTFS
jgi:hypothetical protein